ncbi:MAG: amidohydrolase family protein, partial [Acidobacteria bacterium]|nr:amidohydrolase family protein [Acidobacteriota bacterium]
MKKQLKSGGLAFALLLILCVAVQLIPSFGPSAASASTTDAVPPEVPDLILVNGVIYTGDRAKPRAEAVAVKGERIVAVGSTKEIRALAGAATKVVDLAGKFAMPGFNDAHIHLANGGQAKLTIDLNGSRSLAEFQQRIRARLSEYKPGEWITGRGWDHTIWPVKKFPTRHDLDKVSKDHPMIFTRVDGHVTVANSLALQKAGVTRDTPNPAGGEIEKGADGEPTGMLKENANGLVQRQIPALSPERRRRGLELALGEAASHGITSAQDNSSWEDFLVYEQLKKEG